MQWFVALSHSALGQFMQTSRWGFALVETVHLVALAILGGSVLIIDLRLLGVALKRDSALSISRDLRRLLLGSLVLLILSGIAMLSEEALKCYYNPAFRWKMALLAASVLFYFTVHRRAVSTTAEGGPRAWTRLAALISLTLWLGVGVAGRAIGLI